MKFHLPDIIESAKKRPLSLNPKTGKFVYYDDVANGEAKIYPLEKLSDEQRIDLTVERQLTNEPTHTSVLTGDVFSNEQVADEIRKKTKIGNQLFKSDLEYLEFYLSQFPEDSFEK